MGWPWLLQWRVGALTVRIHAATLLGMFMAGAWFRSTDAVAVYLLVVLIHLGGHALLCWRNNMPVARIDVHAAGGDVSPRGRGKAGALVAIGIGGVAAQLALGLLLLLGAWARGLDPSVGALGELVQLNLLLGALNLLPFPGSDGRFVWTLLREYAEQEQARQLQKEQRRWQGLIASDRARGAVIPPRPKEPDARQALLAASLRAATAAELAERDARADAGIPDDISASLQALLDDAFTAP